MIHRQRGQRSHRAKAEVVRQAAIAAYRQDYPDFGPTLASEKLQARGLEVDHETLRRWLLAEGLLERRRRREVHRQRRERRECFGELIQGDGSHHDWLEGRGPRMVLVVMIDDATSRATARFYEAETTEAYMDLLGRYPALGSPQRLVSSRRRERSLRIQPMPPRYFINTWRSSG